MTRGRRVMAVVVAALATACSSDCELSDELRDRAGAGATDCGRVFVGVDASSVNSCVAAALESRTAFFAQYDRQGIDSLVALGIAGDARGKVTLLRWDSDPSGGSDAGAVIHGEVCVRPALDTSMTKPPTDPPVTCSSTERLGRVCG